MEKLIPPSTFPRLPIRPLHVGIIPDGNRRYSNLHHLDLTEGYLRGIDRLDEILNAINSNDPLLTRIKTLTVYICSTDNVTKRPTEEVNKLIELIRIQIRKYQNRQSLIHKYQIKINIIGNLTYFPLDLQTEALGIQRDTATYSQYILNLAIGYDAKEEIMQAVRSIPDSSIPIFSYLGLQDEIDLVIRTGREKRTSGFFPLMTLYAEYFFLDKFWPEFTVEDLKKVIIEFDQRNRRFGK